MKLPWNTKNKLPPTTAEQTLIDITKVLFPQMRLEEQVSKDGEKIKYHIDYSVDSNLEAALIDLREGFNDEVAHTTIAGIIDRLVMIRKILKVEMKFNSEAKYIIVDDVPRPDIAANDEIF